MKSIVITGASSGIGRATALRLAGRGWRVFAAVRKDSDARALAIDSQGSLETIRLDVTDRESIASAAREVASRLGGRGLDALFNNAGIGSTSPVEYTPLDQLREIFEINLFGQIATIQAFLPLIRAAKGRILNNGSVGDHVTPPFAGALASSKAAFASMSVALRLELRPQGIEVSVLEPGAINTPAVGKALGGVEKTIAGLPPDGAALYAESMRRVVHTFEEKEHAGSPPEAVAEVVERALNDRKTANAVSGGQGLAQAGASRALPSRKTAGRGYPENLRASEARALRARMREKR